jgi:tRNA-dihydrouridine synthase B
MQRAAEKKQVMPEIKPFKIRDVEINPPLVLSPMAGVTDVSFRRLLKRRGGVGLSVSEFISEVETADAIL